MKKLTKYITLIIIICIIGFAYYIYTLPEKYPTLPKPYAAPAYCGYAIQNPDDLLEISYNPNDRLTSICYVLSTVNSTIACNNCYLCDKYKFEVYFQENATGEFTKIIQSPELSIWWHGYSCCSHGEDIIQPIDLDPVLPNSQGILRIDAWLHLSNAGWYMYGSDYAYVGYSITTMDEQILSFIR